MSFAWPYPRVIAHRGGGAFAPENTLAAIRTGRSLGFAAVEFDVMLCADAVPVLFHDETLDRTTGSAGRVAETSSGQLAELDAGSWFGSDFSGERVPGYADAVRLCLDLELWANVEIKPAEGQARETGRVVAAASLELWRSAALDPLLSSFSIPALEEARDAAPGLPRGLLVGAVPPDWSATVRSLGCVSLHCDHRELTAARVAEVRNAGVALLCYTVNDPERARELFHWGASALFTDRLDLIPPDFHSEV